MTAEATPATGATAVVADASLVRAGADAQVVVARLAVARSFWGRFRGLMGRASLDADEGLFLPVNSIHMLFMRMPIDAVFLGAPDGEGHQRVVATRPELRPWLGLVLPVRGAVGVVELRSGTIAQGGIEVGDAFRIVAHAAR